jgi:GST-like protein
MFTVYGAAGSGSVPVEATLHLLGLPYRVVDAANWLGEEAKAELKRVNPMGQAPALILPSGELMTESAAILIWLADNHPESRLSPAPDDPARARFLRWMVYVPAAIYSMFWVRDEPSRLAADKAAEAVILERTRQRIIDCWRIMGEQIEPGAYLLGDQMSVLDIYLAVVSRWTPRRAVVFEAAPNLRAPIERIDNDSRLKARLDERCPIRD